MSAWTSNDEQLLLELLRMDTVTPMETGEPSDLRRAQERFAESAIQCGFDVVQHRPADSSILEDECVPTPVRKRAEEMGDEFLLCQPNLVLRHGPSAPAARTLVFNGHLDTVAPWLEIEATPRQVCGRGAVDAKGPLIGMLAGVRDAIAERPDIAERWTIIIEVVGGEEGGAMGTYGSRELAHEGWLGRLNVVVEPTRMKYMDHGTTSMTAHISMKGRGATDDAPDMGQNATLVLGHIACEIARAVGGHTERRGAKLCIAGLHTGNMHNRVYGEGQLLVNVAYRTLDDANALEQQIEQALSDARVSFTEQFGHLGIAKNCVTDWAELVRMNWLKRRLPVLANRDHELEQALLKAGVPRSQPSDCTPFTCDAMWLQAPESYTVVFGPGDLEQNGAHTDAEHIDFHELATYAQGVSALVQELGQMTVRV